MPDARFGLERYSLESLGHRTLAAPQIGSWPSLTGAIPLQAPASPAPMLHRRATRLRAYAAGNPPRHRGTRKNSTRNAAPASAFGTPGCHRARQRLPVPEHPLRPQWPFPSARIFHAARKPKPPSPMTPIAARSPRPPSVPQATPSSMVGLIMGTGCGSGVVINKQLVEGLHGIGGEWGHNLMCGESTPCYCGKGGCVETVIAGPSLERWFHERTGNALRLLEIVRLSNEANPDALATLDRLEREICRGHRRPHQYHRPPCHRHRRRRGQYRHPLHAENPRAHRQVRLQQRRPHAPSSGPLSVTAPASSAPPCSSPDPALRRRLLQSPKAISRTREAKTAATGLCELARPRHVQHTDLSAGSQNPQQQRRLRTQ